MNSSDRSGLIAASPSKATRPLSAAWRVALPALLIVLAAILLLYRDTAIAMVTIWYRSETFAHAFVVPPIVVWLIWRRRAELAVMVPKPAVWIVLPMLFVGLAWLLADLVAVNAVTQLAFTALLVLAVPAVLGVRIARAIAFPLGFLFFAVPIGEFLLPQLMEWTANFTIVALRLSGVPVYREGLEFVIPSGNWSVVEACSGVRYLIASLTVGTLFAYLNYQSTKRRVLFIIVSILVPIVANWLRAYMIVMLGHLSGNKLAVGVDHLIYGWVFFGIVILLMFFIGSKWTEPERPVGWVVDVEAPTTGFSPAKNWFVSAAVVAVVALPGIGLWAVDRNLGSGTPRMVAPIAFEAGWKATDADSIGFKPAFQNPSAETNTVYTKDGQAVGVYLGYYRDQNYDRKLVSSQNVLVVSKDAVWSNVARGSRPAAFGPTQVTVRNAELRRMALSASDQPSRLNVWQIYWVDGTLTGSDYLAKAYSAAFRLLGRGDHSAVIILYTAKDAAGGADNTLQAFVSANYGAIDALLRQAEASK